MYQRAQLGPYDPSSLKKKNCGGPRWAKCSDLRSRCSATRKRRSPQTFWRLPSPPRTHPKNMCFLGVPQRSSCQPHPRHSAKCWVDGDLSLAKIQNKSLCNTCSVYGKVQSGTTDRGECVAACRTAAPSALSVECSATTPTCRC